MKKLLLFLTFLFSVSYSYSQQGVYTVKVPIGSHVESTDIVDGISTHNYAEKSKIPINGVPFLKTYFQPGILELQDGQKSGEVMLRYNIAKDLFEILRKNDTLTLNRPFAIKYIYLADKVFIFNPKFLEGADRSENGYFQLRIDGKLSLYIKYRKSLKFDSFTPNYKGGSGTKEYYYIDKINYVGKTTDGKAFLLNSSKSLLKNLNEHKAEMKAFIKQNRPRFKKDEDLVKVVEYYNSL